MKLSDIPVPAVYKSSSDFRFFLKWFENCLARIKYDTENLPDLYDPQRCPSKLLWMLADTMGYKFDDRLPVAFNRLVLLYFMSMIRNKGSKTGVTLAANTNLAQFCIQKAVKDSGNDMLNDRLEDTSIPVNSTYVTAHPAEGYIEIVYFSEETPIDACVEYVRPAGMYCFQHAGVPVHTRTKISIDVRLAHASNGNTSIGATRVADYSREDYASLQQMEREDPYLEEIKGADGKVADSTLHMPSVNSKHTRRAVYQSNKDVEPGGSTAINAGYRTLYSLQLSNNEHIVKSLLPETTDVIFSLGHGPQSVKDVEVSLSQPHNILSETYMKSPEYNLRYNKTSDTAPDAYGNRSGETDGTVGTTDTTKVQPIPAVNPVMSTLGDAIMLSDDNTSYTKVDSDGNVNIKK